MKKPRIIHIQKSATYGDWSVYVFPVNRLLGFDDHGEALKWAGKVVSTGDCWLPDPNEREQQVPMTQHQNVNHNESWWKTLIIDKYYSNLGKFGVSEQ